MVSALNSLCIEAKERNWVGEEETAKNPKEWQPDQRKEKNNQLSQMWQNVPKKHRCENLKY